MQISELGEIERDVEGFHCPDCTTPYPSLMAAAVCGCDSEE